MVIKHVLDSEFRSPVPIYFSHFNICFSHCWSTCGGCEEQSILMMRYLDSESWLCLDPIV